MIRKNELFIKLSKKKISSKSVHMKMMEDFRPELETCPICKSKGNCSFHASYDRYAIDFIHGRPVESRITITRVICSSCNHTHAILADSLIPYDSYSVFFILWALAFYFSESSTVQKLCERFCIPPTTLYRWLKTFKSHKQEWLGILEDRSTSSTGFIRHLRNIPCFSRFTLSFFQRTGISFLQTHANPADCRQT